MLKGDFQTVDPTQFAVTIANAGNVTLNLRGHHLKGAGQTSQMAGVHAYGTERVRIYNGKISGFRIGVRVDSQPGSRAIVRHLKVSDNFLRGIAVKATQGIIAGNVVSNTVGQPGIVDSYAVGIEFSGQNCRIRGNVVTGLHPIRFGEGVGVSISSPASKCLIEKNSIYNPNAEPDARTIGLWIGLQEFSTLRTHQIKSNRVNDFTHGDISTNRVARSIVNNSFRMQCGKYDTKIAVAIGSRNKIRKYGICQDSVSYWRRIEQKDAYQDIRYAIALMESLDLFNSSEKIRSPVFNERLEDAIRILKSSWVPEIDAHLRRAEMTLMATRAD